MTGNPEVISSPVGLVPTNALVLTGLANFRVVGNSETIRKRRPGKQQMLSAVHTVQKPILRSSCSLPSEALFHFADALFERAYSEVGLLFVYQQGRRKTQRRVPRAENQISFVKSALQYFVAQIRRLFLGSLVTDNLSADHQPAAADVADDFELVRPIRQACEDVLAHAAGVLDEPAFEQVQRCHRCGDANGVAAKRRGVRPGLPVHYAFP